MEAITSRPYQPNPAQCCEACVFGRGEHAAWCVADLCIYCARPHSEPRHWNCPLKRAKDSADSAEKDFLRALGQAEAFLPRRP